MLIKKTNKTSKRIVFICLILILVAVLLSSNKYFNKINLFTSNYSWNNYTNIEWIIEKFKKAWYNEYYLKTTTYRILLKEYPEGIDYFLGKNILLQWEIKTLSNNQFFLIKVLKDLDNNVIIDNKYTYFFLDELLLIKTKEIHWILPIKVWNEIVIYYKNNPLVKISVFWCSKISSSRDCQKLIDDFDLHENEYFNSYNGLFYYKINDNRREFFNDTFLWYYIQTKDDSVLLNLSSIIEVIDSNYIFNNYKDIILMNCKNLINIEDTKILWKDWNILSVNVIWRNKLKEKNECKLKLDIFNNWKIIEGN